MNTFYTNCDKCNGTGVETVYRKKVFIGVVCNNCKGQGIIIRQ